MNEWHSYTLMRIAQDVSEIKSRVGEMTTWLQRGALLAILWGAGIVANVSAEDKAQIIAALIKSLAP